MKKITKVLLATCVVLAIGFGVVKTTDVEKKANLEITTGTADVKDPGGGGRP
ncbi:hypothetical protein NSS71_08335 [Niallia sp. FSL W8-0951]|uniref:hypothetical protein n=1 Tax=Niallia sp. FSL W8-0951 TaxID=2954639 RepID=UPI0030F50E36